jgi:hypothetical protein
MSRVVIGIATIFAIAILMSSRMYVDIKEYKVNNYAC